MDKASIKRHILANKISILEYLNDLPEQALNVKEGEKWSAAQNIEHLIKSVAPINLAMSLPRIALLLFGSGDKSRTYEDITALYSLKIREGAKASGPYIPAVGREYRRTRLAAGFENHYSTLISKIDQWSEDQLDRYRLPHPILGKLTVREMLYFTSYHMEHHLAGMKRPQ